MMIGDMNAKVGHGRTEDIVGPHGLGIINERGDKLLDWCLEKEHNNKHLVQTSSKTPVDLEKSW